MGITSSSPTDPSQLQRNTSSSSNSGAKFMMVYQGTPAIMYRPDTFQEAVNQARHTFQIPRYQPLEFSYKYLSVGFVALTEHNWNAIIPSIHTLFITTLPPPPSSGSSPHITDSRRLSPAPFSHSQMSHDWSEHSQSTEMSNVIPPSPLDPRPLVQSRPVTATATTDVEPATSRPNQLTISLPIHSEMLQPPNRTPTTPIRSPLGNKPLPVQSPHATVTATTVAVDSVPSRPSDLTVSVPLTPETLSKPTRTPITPIRSPLGNKPLPTPPSRRPVSLPHFSKRSSISIIPPAPRPPNHPPAFSPPSISPSTDPLKISIIIYHDDQASRNTLPEYRILHLPKTHTIADLKDVLSDGFVMPAYLQELWIAGKMLEEDGDERVLEAAGVVHGSVIVLNRAGVGKKVQQEVHGL